MQEGECVKTTSRTNHSVRVPIGAKHAETVRVRWTWVESTVWTERMLTALDVRDKAGRWSGVKDQQCWPSTDFADRGLFSLLATYESEHRQSSLR